MVCNIKTKIKFNYWTKHQYSILVFVILVICTWYWTMTHNREYNLPFICIFVSQSYMYNHPLFTRRDPWPKHVQTDVLCQIEIITFVVTDSLFNLILWFVYVGLPKHLWRKVTISVGTLSYICAGLSELFFPISIVGHKALCFKRTMIPCLLITLWYGMLLLDSSNMSKKLIMINILSYSDQG